MPTIEGLNNKDGRLVIINESDWSVEHNELLTADPDNGYEVSVASGTKTVVYRLSTGEIEAYGNVTPKADPIPDTWYSAFDNTYFEAGDEYVNTGEGYEYVPMVEWVSDGEGGGYWRTLAGSWGHRARIDVKADTTWAVDFRPTKVRITHTADNSLEEGYSVVVGTIDADIGQASILGTDDWQNFPSPGVINITFEGKGSTEPLVPADIGKVLLGPNGGEGSYNITNIEFNADPGEPGSTMSWQTAFDNTYWSGDSNTAWNGSAWVENGPPGSIMLEASSSLGWANGFRPSKVRVTGVVNWATTIRIHDGAPGFSGNIIAEGTCASTVELDCSFASAGNIRTFLLYGYSSVTNIEFLGGEFGLPS